MKFQSSILAYTVAMCLSSLAFAQQPTDVKTFITGDLSAKYDSRNGGSSDTYTLTVNVSNSALFKGTIVVKPYKPGTIYGGDMGSMVYSIDTDVVNPNNPAQTMNVGKLYGSVPIDEKNVYRFQDGNLKLIVNDRGTAKGFDSKFSGYALGKPPSATSLVDKASLSFSKTVNGKAVKVNVTKYDKMEFKNHIIASGPVRIYGEVTVNGAMVYDYERGVWYFQNLAISYPVEGRVMIDSLSGSIRWVEGANRSKTGEGEYQFDIRVNEPPPSEASVFAGPQDESAFFSVDTTIPSLTGTMKYKDTISGKSVTASAVKVDLQGNKLTKQQAMYLCKLLFLTSIVPLNAE
jgi:hypothetical protein